MMNRRLTRRLSTIEGKLSRTGDDNHYGVNRDALTRLSDVDLELLEQALTLVESGEEAELSYGRRGALDRWNQVHSEALAGRKEQREQGKRTIRSSRGVR